MIPAGDAPARVQRGALLVLAAVGAVTVLLGAWAGLRWSMIGIGVDARITNSTWAEEGPPFKVLQLDDGRALTVDSVILDRLGGPERAKGQVLHKQVGSRTLHAGQTDQELRMSREAWKTLAALVGLVGFALIRAGQGVRSRSSRAAR